MTARLHVVTDDAVLSAPTFLETAAALAAAFGGDVALHLRGHATAAARLYELAIALEQRFAGTGTALLVADRVDVALATDTAGVRLGVRSIPIAAARDLVGGRVLAASVHGVEEAEAAERAGADLLVLGTIWRTGSHPGRKGAGPGLVERVAARARRPVIAIGGVTPDRAAVARAAGAAGVCVLRGIWSAPAPVSAAREYLVALNGPEPAGAGAADMAGEAGGARKGAS